MNKRNKKFIGLIAISILAAGITGYFSRGYITQALSSYKENLKTVYKSYAAHECRQPQHIIHDTATQFIPAVGRCR